VLVVGPAAADPSPPGDVRLWIHPDPAAWTGGDSVALLERAVAVAGGLVAGVRTDQWEGRTPCPDFDVRALVQHMVGGLRQFTDLARGEQGETAGEPSPETADPAAVYDDAARRAVAAWASPPALDREYEVPWGRLPGHVLVGFLLIEALGHGWDLAQATGQNPAFDDDLADAGLELARTYDGSGMRAPGLFGPPVDVPAGAPVLDRLAGFLGRRPATGGA
jgi:uncharacterized protein (TIGR03086 family)